MVNTEELIRIMAFAIVGVILGYGYGYMITVVMFILKAFIKVITLGV